MVLGGDNTTLISDGDYDLDHSRPVLGVARHSETLEELIVYRQEYGDYGLWVRPKQMFLETVEVDGQEMPRFQWITGLD